MQLFELKGFTPPEDLANQFGLQVERWPVTCHFTYLYKKGVEEPIAFTTGDDTLFITEEGEDWAKECEPRILEIAIPAVL